MYFGFTVKLTPDPVTLDHSEVKQINKVVSLKAEKSKVSVIEAKVVKPKHTKRTEKKPVTHVTPRITPVLQGKEAWLSASNIASSDYQYVDYIVMHESSWSPNATEPNTGAHGLPQALPYSKTGCGWSDAVCQLNWADTYAKSRYGSWYSAYIYWTNNRNW